MMTELSIIAERSVNRDTKSAEQNRHQVVRLLCRPTPAGSTNPAEQQGSHSLVTASQPKDTGLGAAFSREKAKMTKVLVGNSRHKWCWLSWKSDY